MSAIACGHSASMAAVAAAVAFRLPLERTALQFGAGVLLVIALACRLRRGDAWAGQAGMALWAFIISIAHGAGFVLVPSLMTICGSGAVGPALAVLGAMGIHMAVMLAANGVIAYIVFFITRKAHDTMRMIFILLLLAALPAAQATDCQTNLRWKDGTYIERTDIEQGEQGHVVIKQFANAIALGLKVRAGTSSMIMLTGKGDDDGISFLWASDDEKPSHFQKASALAAGPFWTEAKLAGPCALKDKVTLQLSDVLQKKPAAQKGWIRRNGMTVDYSIQEAPGVEIQGSWHYASQLQNLPLEADMQGWRVYRHDTLLMTLPKGKPLPLSAALEQLRGAAH